MSKKYLALLLTLVFSLSGFALYGQAESLKFNRIKNSPGAVPLLKNGSYLYAAGDKGFAVYDLKEPQKPKLISLLAGVNGRQMAVSGKILYVTARQQGLWIFDISDAAKPRLIRHYDTVELATGIAVNGNYVFIASRIYGIEILDCTDPANPRHVGFVRNGELQSVAISGRHLFGTDWGKGHIHTWDVSDLHKPKYLGYMQLDGFADGLFIKDGICYAATGMHAVKNTRRLNQGHGLGIFDIKDPAKPVRLGGIKFPPSPIRYFDSWTVSVSDGTAYIGDTVCGVFIVDVRNPASPRLLASGKLPKHRGKDNPVGGVAVGDGVIYVSGKANGVFVTNWSSARPVKVAPQTQKPCEISVPELGMSGFKRLDINAQVRRVYLDGDTLWAACSHQGIRSFRITDKELVPLNQYPVKCSYDVVVRNGRIYSAEGSRGLAVYKIGPDGGLVELGRDKYNAMHLFMGKNPAFLAATCGHLDVVVKDVSDPSNMKELFRKRFDSIFYTDTFADREADGVLCVSCHGSGTLWLDMNGTEPKLLHQDTRRIACQRIAPCVIGSRIMMPAKTRGYLLLDPHNPAEKNLVFHKVRGLKNVVGAAAVSDDGKTVVLTTRNTGSIYTLDFSNPEKAAVIPERSCKMIHGSPGRAVFYNGRIIIPAGHSGILYETL